MLEMHSNNGTNKYLNIGTKKKYAMLQMMCYRNKNQCNACIYVFKNKATY